jgi:hypothetical protein
MSDTFINNDGIEQPIPDNPYLGTAIHQPNDEGCKKCYWWWRFETGACWDCRGHDEWRPVEEGQVEAYAKRKQELESVAVQLAFKKFRDLLEQYGEKEDKLFVIVFDDDDTMGALEGSTIRQIDKGKLFNPSVTNTFGDMYGEYASDFEEILRF